MHGIPVAQRAGCLFTRRQTAQASSSLSTCAAEEEVTTTTHARTSLSLPLTHSPPLPTHTHIFHLHTRWPRRLLIFQSRIDLLPTLHSRASLPHVPPPALHSSRIHEFAVLTSPIRHSTLYFWPHHGFCMSSPPHHLNRPRPSCVSRAYQHGAPGPAASHLQVDPFLFSLQDAHRHFPSAGRDWEHREEEEQSELQSGY